MRSDVVRLYKTVHTWTGVVAGMLLFICFYAGALTMFEELLGRWASPPSRVVAAAPERADELIAKTLAARPEAAKDFTLHLADDARPAKIVWKKSRNDDASWSATLASDGELRLEQSRSSGLAKLVDMIHRTAGVPGDPEIGTTFMGMVSAVYVIALVSGVIVVLPSLVKDFFALRLGANLKRMWLDAHNVVGVVSLPFHVAIALTAVVFGLHEPLYDALDYTVYDGRLKSIMRASAPLAPIPRDERPAAMLPVAELLARVEAVSADFTPTSLQYRDAGAKGAVVRVAGQDPRDMVRGSGFAVLSPVTGAVVNTEYLPGHQSAWSATVSTFFALHFGSYGGGVVRWSYFVLGLAGAFLFYSGNLLWIESRRRTERRHGGPVPQKTSVRLMAAGTVGVCLGSVCGISLAIVSAKWLHGHVADVDVWSRGVYYAVFLGAIVWAFARHAARAGVDLLRLAALAAAAIPVTTLLAWAAPSLGPWMSADADSLGVDLVALCFALCFAWMAHAAGRRAKDGPADSVWSAREASARADGGDGNFTTADDAGPSRQTAKHVDRSEIYG